MSSPLHRHITWTFSQPEFVVFSKSHATFRHPRMLRLLTRSSFLFLRDAGSSRSRVQVQLLVRPARRRNIHRRPGAIGLPTPPPLSNLATSKDADAARDWLTRFKGSTIPRTAVDIAFSRSSGPGGQVGLYICVSTSASHRSNT